MRGQRYQMSLDRGWGQAIHLKEFGFYSKSPGKPWEAIGGFQRRAVSHEGGNVTWSGQDKEELCGSWSEWGQEEAGSLCRKLSRWQVRKDGKKWVDS